MFNRALRQTAVQVRVLLCPPLFACLLAVFMHS